MKPLVIARMAVTRLLRDRANIFFVFLMPMLLILVMGAAFGAGTEPKVGVLAEGVGPLGQDLAKRISAVDGIDASVWRDRDALILAVERGTLDGGALIPATYDETLARGERVTVEFVAGTGESAQALGSTIESVVTEQGAVLRAAAFAVVRTGVDHETALFTAQAAAGVVAPLAVETSAAGELSSLQRLGQYELGAYSQLLLFIFLTSMTGASALIESRRLGVSARMLATPTSARSVLVGEALGRLAVALVQGVFIMAGTALFFDVGWGDPLGAVAVLLLFSLVASGAALLIGSVLSTVEQANGVGVMLGIGMGALGGAMVPLAVMEFFSPTLYQVAHITPHAWGIRAFEKLIIHGGSFTDILPELGVLGAFAIALYALGAWRLRIALTRP